MSLVELVDLFRAWLHLPDPGALEVILGAVVANRMAGDPVWLLLIGPPGAGKTVLLATLRDLPDVYSFSTLTRAGLLTLPRRADDDSGGLLNRIGSGGQGVALVEDFSTMLGESPDSRRAIFADLRRVYDGSFERELAGRKIGWNGTLGLLGACTEAIEDHRDELATLGERLVYYRMPRLDPSGRAAVLSRARANVGQQQAMRTKLAEAAAGFLTGMSVPNEPPALDDTIARWIEHLADTSATFRSPVQRGGHHSDEITLVPEPEVPTRVVAVLTQLWRGLEVIGVDDSEARRLIHHVAIGGVPTLRRRVFVLLSQKSIAVTTAHVAGMLGLPRTTVRRHLQDLAALGLLEGRDNFQNEERWSVPAEVARRWPLVGQPEEFVHGVEAPRLLDLDGSQRAHVAAEFGVSLDGEDPP